MHAAADEFVSAYPRASLDLEFLLDRPSELVASLLKERAERVLSRLIEEIRAAIRSRTSSVVSIGDHVIGDLTLDNLHTGDGGQIVFYDSIQADRVGGRVISRMGKSPYRDRRCADASAGILARLPSAPAVK